MARETDFAWLRFHVSDASRTASEEADSDLKASEHTDEPEVADDTEAHLKHRAAIL